MTPAPVPVDGLAGLHDLALPGPVSLTPATPAWLLVLALAVAALAWALLHSLRRRRRNRYRREAELALRAIEARLVGPATRHAALAELPVLVKRVALHFASRQEIAGLSGDSWLAWLDRTWKAAAFTAGPGRLVAELAYATPSRLDALPPAEVDALVALLRTWAARHREPRGHAGVAAGREGAP